MNTNKLKTPLFIVLIITLQLFSNTTAGNLSSSNYFPSQLQEFSTANTIERNLTLSIVFVNFEKELIDENYIEQRLPDRFEWVYYSPHEFFWVQLGT